MPAVIPVFAAIGTAFGASAATAATTGFVISATAVSAGATVYSSVQQNRAARAAAGVDQATADYNARADIAMARQLDLDTIQNVRTARADDAVYLSRQEASYASAGVLANTGSPLQAQIMNAGRMEQQIQQNYLNSQQKQQQFAASASVGRLEGSARANADRTQGRIALINGGASLARQAFSAYDSGVFSGLGKSKTLGGGFSSDSPMGNSSVAVA